MAFADAQMPKAGQWIQDQRNRQNGVLGATYLEYPSVLRLIGSAPEENPQRCFPKYQSHSVLKKASPVPAFFLQLLPTQKCIKHSGAPAVTLDVMRTQVFGKHCREASLVWRLAGNTEAEAIPQHSGCMGRSGQHFLVHLPREAPRKMCPNGGGTFFSFSKRSHVCCHWSCLYARHILPFPEVSGLHWESRVSYLHDFPVPSLLYFSQCSARAAIFLSSFWLMLQFYSQRSNQCYPQLAPSGAEPRQNLEVVLPSDFSGLVSSSGFLALSPSGIRNLVFFPLLAFWAPQRGGGARSLAGWPLIWPLSLEILLLENPHRPLRWSVSSPLSNSTWWSFLSMTP